MVNRRSPESFKLPCVFGRRTGGAVLCWSSDGFLSWFRCFQVIYTGALKRYKIDQIWRQFKQGVEVCRSMPNFWILWTVEAHIQLVSPLNQPVIALVHLRAACNQAFAWCFVAEKVLWVAKSRLNTVLCVVHICVRFTIVSRVLPHFPFKTRLRSILCVQMEFGNTRLPRRSRGNWMSGFSYKSVGAFDRKRCCCNWNWPLRFPSWHFLLFGHLGTTEKLKHGSQWFSGLRQTGRFGSHWWRDGPCNHPSALETGAELVM